jgi:hypothetical protein
MNIALCYSGQIRDFNKCFETHVKHIVEANKSCNFYIFIHSWSDKSLEGQSYFKDRLGRDRGFYKTENVLNVMGVNPDSALLEKPIEFNSDLTPDPRFPHPMQNTLSMFYSIMMSDQIKNVFCSLRGIKIDWSLRLRTDLFFHKDLILEEYDNNNLYINDQYVHTDYAVNDLFSFSKDSNMIEYSQTFRRINDMVKNGCAVNPECFLGYNLHASNAEVIKKTPLQNHYYKLFSDL